jgi:hypothetical protein
LEGPWPQHSRMKTAPKVLKKKPIGFIWRKTPLYMEEVAFVTSKMKVV